MLIASLQSPTPLPAKTRKIALLCLGADVELTLTPEGGFQTTTPETPLILQDDVAASQVIAAMPPEDEFEPYDPMDDDDAPIGAGLLQEAHGAEADVSTLPTQDDTPLSQAKKDDVLFLTLAHGDGLLLEGDNFNVSISLSPGAVSDIVIYFSGRCVVQE